jgi:hypothetical protein
VVLGDSILDSGESEGTGARVRYFLALSQLQLGRPDRARSHLDAARNYHEAAHDAERLVECMAMKPSSDIDLFTTTLPFPVLGSLSLFLRRT